MYRSLMALIDGVVGTPRGAPQVGGLATIAEPPERLIRAVDSGECFLFAGEGVATDVGLPSWAGYLSGLIDHLARCRAITREQADDLRSLWTNGRYDLLAQSIRSIADSVGGREAFYARRVYSKAVEASRTLEALASTGFCAVVTPNVDTAIESAMECESLGPLDVHAAQDRIAEAVPFVLKMRGTAGRRDLRIWQDLAFAELPAACAEAFGELFRTRTMLAIGVSADELIRWLEAAGVAHADRTHYLVAPPADRELKRKAGILFRKFHVRVLVAPDDDVLPFLRKLSGSHKLSH